MDKNGRRKAERILRDVGFMPVRDTTHGTLWRRGPTMVLVGRPTGQNDPRAFRNFRATLKRAGISI